MVSTGNLLYANNTAVCNVSHVFSALLCCMQRVYMCCCDNIKGQYEHNSKTNLFSVLYNKLTVLYDLYVQLLPMKCARLPLCRCLVLAGVV